MEDVIPVIPPAIWALPDGHYGISYDISLHDTEDDLPNGWHSHRGEGKISLK
jgi:hypothetical protein